MSNSQEIDERLASQLTADEQDQVEQEYAALAAEMQATTHTDSGQAIPPMPSAPTLSPMSNKLSTSHPDPVAETPALEPA